MEANSQFGGKEGSGAEPIGEATRYTGSKSRLEEPISNVDDPNGGTHRRRSSGEDRLQELACDQILDPACDPVTDGRAVDSGDRMTDDQGAADGPADQGSGGAATDEPPPGRAPSKLLTGSVCGICGGEQASIRINVDGNTLLMESCDGCDARRWQLAGERIDLHEALNQVGEHSGRRR